MIDWILKDDIEPVGSSNGFWYDLTDGGYIRLEDILADNEQLKQVKEAIETLTSFKDALETNDLINEF